MSKKEGIQSYLAELKKRLRKELPKISKEIRIYEQKLREGKTNPNPTPGPQFNG
jgi:hypothetical protein